jgi:hypothetical protein
MSTPLSDDFSKAQPVAFADGSEISVAMPPAFDPTSAGEPAEVGDADDSGNAKPSARGLHILKDEDGTERKFGSALGLLTRQFVDLLQVCHPAGFRCTSQCVSHSEKVT